MSPISTAAGPIIACGICPIASTLDAKGNVREVKRLDENAGPVIKTGAMARLEDITRGACVRGILPDALVNVVDVTWHGSDVLELVYKDSGGQPTRSCHLGSADQAIGTPAKRQNDDDTPEHSAHRTIKSVAQHTRSGLLLRVLTR